MTYATQQDLIDRIGEDELIQLTDRNNTNSINSSVVGRALADADAEINSYVVARYALPLPEVPAILVRLACDIAHYQLSGNRVGEAVRTRYEDAVKYLKSLSKGEAQLGVASGEPAAPTDAGIAYVAPPRAFNRKNLSDY
jgi:phage gp36-like protein